MPRGRPSRNGNKQIKIVCSNPKCKHSGEPQSEDMFYKCNKFGIERYPVCKTCLLERINIDDINSVCEVLKDMDIVFDRTLWDKVYNSNDSNNVFDEYMERVTRYKKGLGYGDSVFDLIDKETGEVIKEDENKLIYSKEWNGWFTQTDVDYLNNYLEGLKSDYKIVTTNHMDYAKKIAKASLAMDREFEKVMRGESDAVYKNLRETFDKLSNSAKFSESQRSANDVGLGSFGVIAGRVEKHTWIPEYEPVDMDTYDLIIQQFSNIEKSL